MTKTCFKCGTYKYVYEDGWCKKCFKSFLKQYVICPECGKIILKKSPAYNWNGKKCVYCGSKTRKFTEQDYQERNVKINDYCLKCSNLMSRLCVLCEDCSNYEKERVE